MPGMKRRADDADLDELLFVLPSELQDPKDPTEMMLNELALCIENFDVNQIANKPPDVVRKLNFDAIKKFMDMPSFNVDVRIKVLYEIQCKHIQHILQGDSLPLVVYLVLLLHLNYYFYDEDCIFDNNEVYEFIKLLIAKGANLTNVDSANNNFLHYVCQLYTDHIYQILPSVPKELFDQKNSAGLAPWQIYDHFYSSAEIEKDMLDVLDELIQYSTPTDEEIGKLLPYLFWPTEEQFYPRLISSYIWAIQNRYSNILKLFPTEHFHVNNPYNLQIKYILESYTDHHKFLVPELKYSLARYSNRFSFIEPIKKDDTLLHLVLRKFNAAYNATPQYENEIEQRENDMQEAKQLFTELIKLGANIHAVNADGEKPIDIPKPKPAWLTNCINQYNFRQCLFKTKHLSDVKITFDNINPKETFKPG